MIELSSLVLTMCVWIMIFLSNVFLLISRKGHLLSILLGLEAMGYVSASLYCVVFKQGALWFLGIMAAFGAMEAATGLVLLVLLIRWSGSDRPMWLHISGF